MRTFSQEHYCLDSEASVTVEGSARLNSESHPPQSEPPHHRGTLARELQELIHKLDAIDAAAADVPEIDSGYAQDSGTESFGRPARLAEEIGDLHQEIREIQHLVELRIQQLLSVQRSQHAELLQALLRAEQELHDEMALFERRMRGDISALMGVIVAGGGQLISASALTPQRKPD